MDQQTPANLPLPNASARQRFGARLAAWSLCLAIAAPISAVLAWFVAGIGNNCVSPPTAPIYNSFVLPSIVLYYGAVVACAAEVIGGAWALWSARREPLAEGYRAAAISAIVLGVLVGVPIVFCSPLFNYLYDAGLHGYCAEI